MSNTKTTKTVRGNHSQVCHIWAQRNGTNAKATNLFSEGDAIFSFGHHFCIARHFANVVLFNQRRYGARTGKQQCYARRAVSHRNIIEVPNLGVGSCGTQSPLTKVYHDTNLAYLKEQIETAAQTASKARTRKEYALDSLRRAIANYNAYLIAFKLRNKPISIDTEYGLFVEEQNRKIEAIKRAEAKQARERKTKNIEYARAWLADDTQLKTLGSDTSIEVLNDEPELKAACIAKNQRLIAKDVQDWKDGNPGVRPDYSWPTILRREGDEIVTSKDARFPVDHARKAYDILKRLRDRGETYHRNGTMIHVGHFAIDNLYANGVVQAGCHNIQWDDIEDLASREAWKSEVISQD